MTTSLSWPAALPMPLLETHGFQPRPPVARTEIERGKADQRRRFKQVPTVVPFSLVLDDGEASIWEAWVEYKAQQGARWFAIDLWSGIGLASHEARIETVEQVKQVRRDRWKVTGNFEVRERPMLSAEMLELALVLESDPYEMLAVLETLSLLSDTIQLQVDYR